MSRVTGQKIGVEATNGLGFPAFQSVAGAPGYPATSPPLKGALNPYWATGRGVPTYTAPTGSLYTQQDVTLNGAPTLFVYTPVTVGATTANTWSPISGAAFGTIPAGNVIAGTFVGAFTFALPPTMSGANIAAGTISVASLTGILPILNGGTGTATPSLVNGTNTTVSGTWPAQSINVATGAGGVTAVTGSGNISVTAGTTPNVTFTGILPVASGGNGTATPALVAGTNTGVSGSWPAQAVNVTSIPASIVQPGTFAGASLFTFPAGLKVTGALDVTGAIRAGSATAPSVGAGDGAFSRSTTTGNIAIGGSSSNAGIDYGTTTASVLTVTAPTDFLGPVRAEAPAGSTKAYLPPVYTKTGTDPSSGSGTMHIVTGSGTTDGSGVLSVTLTGAAAFTNGTSYVAMAVVMDNGTGDLNVQVLTQAAGSFSMAAYLSGGGAATSKTVNWIAIGY